MKRTRDTRTLKSVPSFNNPHCIVSNGNEGDLVSEMVKYLVNISQADEWIQWEAGKRGIRIRYQLNQTQKRFAARQLPVDGFHKESQTVFQFHGCYWHGQRCHLTQGKEVNKRRKRPMVELYDETKAITNYIRDQGYRVVYLGVENEEHEQRSSALYCHQITQTV